MRGIEIGDTVIKFEDEIKGTFWWGVVAGFFTKDKEEYLYFNDYKGERGAEEPVKLWRVVKEEDVRKAFALKNDLPEFGLCRNEKDIEYEVNMFMSTVLENKRKMVERKNE